MINYSTCFDQELVLLLKDDDDAAFKEIYLRYDKLLLIYAYKKLRNREEAKDLVQDVFTWLWNSRKDFSLNTTLSGYLYKSVLNRIFDVVKHKGIIRKYVDSGKHYVEISNEDTDYLIREKDIALLIEKEILTMPPKMREIYTLKKKYFLSTKEIATELSLSEHTVSTQMKRALKHLKVKLGIIVLFVTVGF
ncbi:RNA polymerase sigma-70 factor [Pedobacter panaciterrae]|jgi:RNA polymerase sigma-70 factor, Bacteroides expansion family 1|uniref:RNA polymerase sigma-70 factor n=1 Tax=Pedobacter panaciterrae TaxID=363849 RepID=A0ABU8NNQ0_9SPHI|nr:RNA polymerase sigma-70 factor [Pedobacter panaciterrae]NQX52690.1 RNA polymerase sigma-70 factor [Pedobacter panaciterrae]